MQDAWMKSAASQTTDVMVSKPKARQGLPRRGNGRPTLLEPLENRCMLSSILGSAAAYGVLGATTVTNAGATVIVGDLGVSPGTAITGVSADSVSGTIDAGNASAGQAHADLATAYNLIAAEPTTTNLTGQNLGGLTLAPGVYSFGAAAQLTGALTLDAQGDPNARFVFKIGSTLTTGTASAVQLIDGAQADNVYFEVGSSATIAPDTALQGNILANTSITLDAGATILDGRALAINGAVTMDTNQVTIPEADISVMGTLVGGSAVAGDNITYFVVVTNTGPNNAQNVVLSDLLPTQTTFVSTVQNSGPTFLLTNPAVGSTGTITGTIPSLADGASASFTIVARVLPGTPIGTSITNSLAVTSDTVDPNLANNSQTITTSVVAAPTITGVSPAEGVIAGGTLVTIAGTNLESATAVDFGSVAVTSFVSDSNGQVVLLSPAGTAGTVDVTAITPGGTSALSASDQFTYGIAPVINSPGGDAFTVGSPGTFLISTTGFPAPTLTISALPAGLTLVDNLNGTATLSGTPGINTAGEYPLTITASNGISPDATQSFALAVQNLQADILVAGTTVGGAVVAGNNIPYSVAVTNLGPNNAQNVVLSNLLPTQTTFVSDAQTSGPAFVQTSPTVGNTGTITDTIVSLASGAFASFTIVAQVQPGTLDGTSIVDSLSVTADTSDPNLANNSQTITTSVVAPPVITGVSPAEGATAGGTLVTIAGTSLENATAVDFGSVAVTSFVSDSNGQIVLLSPAGTAGTVDVTAITPGGTSAISASDQFIYSASPVVAAPTITGVSPAEGAPAGGTLVTIAGTNLENATAVDFGSLAVTSFVSDSNSQIVLLSPAGTAGTVDVTATTLGGASATTPSDQFTYSITPPVVAAPTITGVSPAEGAIAGGTLVTIAGTNLENATAVDFGSVAVTSFVSDSNGQIVLLSPAGTAGTVDVTAITPGGTSVVSASDQFTYGTAPVVPVTPTLTTLTVSAPANNVNPNRTLQFTAAGTNASGLSVALGPVTWSLDSGSTGSIDQNGLYTAGNVGGAGETAIVRATSGGQTATQGITVNPVLPGAETTQVSSVTPVGNAQSITGFVVTFNGPVNPTAAQDVGGYQIVGQYTFNKHRNFMERMFGGNSGAQTVYAGYQIASAVYNSQTNSVTLTLASNIPLGTGTLWVEVMGTGSDAVLDANGKPIDGDANGTAGGSYRYRFGMTVTRSISYQTATGELVNLFLSGPGEIVTLFPGDTDTPLIDLIDTDSQSSILTGNIDKGHNSVAYAVLAELNGTANANIQLGDGFHINQNNAVATP
jgi:uncharacterized repeat protein (TIGR01451 family)